jgi:hypothetical protein
LCILLGVFNVSNGGEPTTAKERNRQRARERYAQMDKQKKDELLKKRREAYKEKKSRLQSTQAVTNTRESRDGSSALAQLQSMSAIKGALYIYVSHILCFLLQLNQMILAFYPGDTTWNNENTIPGENDACHSQTPPMPSQGQEILATGTNIAMLIIHM